MELIDSIPLWAIIIVLLICYGVSWVMERTHGSLNEWLEVENIRKKLSYLDFFHSVLYQSKSHIVDGVSVFTDATYTVVFKQNGKPLALIGFTLGKDIMTVYQLQGIPGVNVKGQKIGLLLIPYAEEIAHRLGKSMIRIQSAYRHTYYELDETSSKYPQLYAHQERLRSIYDASAFELGYVRQPQAPGTEMTFVHFSSHDYYENVRMRHVGGRSVCVKGLPYGEYFVSTYFFLKGI